jgi:hypothetical protein
MGDDEYRQGFDPLIKLQFPTLDMHEKAGIAILKSLAIFISWSPSFAIWPTS